MLPNFVSFLQRYSKNRSISAISPFDRCERVDHFGIFWREIIKLNSSNSIILPPKIGRFKTWSPRFVFSRNIASRKCMLELQPFMDGFHTNKHMHIKALDHAGGCELTAGGIFSFRISHSLHSIAPS